MNKKNYLIIATLLSGLGQDASPAQPLADWPRVPSAVKRDAVLEARVKEIVASMTLRQKIGQMTQAEIGAITPDEVREYYIGSVLNGGGSWPGKNKYARAADWVSLSDQFYEASMATDMKFKVPVIWGIDAIHGNSNVFGATLYPHNIGLGAAHDKRAIGRMAQGVARAVRAIGINWVFAPTLATVRDDRWGRTYESFSEDPALVRDYAVEYVKGLQGNLRGDGNVVATAKHFIGDGATDHGTDQGNSQVTRADMINIYGQGYYGALAAGVQTVMASYNSWDDVSAGLDYGKMHGSRELLTDALKSKMGFDGFVVSDWNGIGQVKGCTNDSCAQAINAGVDMVMAPNDWKAFIANTVRQVAAGEIPVARIDDAVSRIVRVKLRAGLFDKKPSGSSFAGKQDALQDRTLARELVHKSLVLLKNDTGALPLARGKRILVVGEGASSLPLQTGGWSLSWQGTGNRNSDFPYADTILEGIEEANGKDKVVYSIDAEGVDLGSFDAVIAVLAESPYAEGAGDIVGSGTLRHASRYPQDLAVLQKVAGKGKPVVTILLSGRPLWINDLMNMSDTFVAAWLPGTEGKGVADVLFQGGYPFTGTLSFSWPKTACQAVLNINDRDYAPLFKVGYGLKGGARSRVGQVDAGFPEGGCTETQTMAVYVRGNHAAWPLAISGGGERKDLGRDLDPITELRTIKVENGELGPSQEGKRVTWSGAGRFEAHAPALRALPAFAMAGGALQFDVAVPKAPAGAIKVGFGSASLDLTRVFAGFAGKPTQTVRIPLECFGKRGASLDAVDTPFSVETDAAFTAVFGNIVVTGAGETAALACEDLK